VKIEKMAKLQTSCSTPVAEGMTVHTRDAESVEGRAGVFEFLLINHPLDCPVCDKGGECPLQDFSYSFGNAESRMDFERRTFDGQGVKADVDFGPTLMLNRNRCILCTRCVRFMREIDGDAQIGIVDRSNGSEIATFNEQGVHSLLSGNLMDVCPVGAITTRQYRFRSRPWDNPNAVDTICTLCSKGCNTTAWIKAKPEWAKGSRLVRMTPVFNPDVNDYWMCDIGRFQYTWVEADNRLRKPLVLTNGVQQHVSWKDALLKVRDLVKASGTADGSSVRILASAHASLEELFLLRLLAAAITGEAGSEPLHLAWRQSQKRQPEHTKFRVPATDAPNLSGARALGLPVTASGNGEADLVALRTAVDRGSLRLLYVVDPGPEGSLGDAAWIVEARRSGRLPVLVYQGVVASALAGVADVVLPGAAWVEKNACYVNDQGRVQAASKAINPPGEAAEDWQIVTSVAAALGRSFSYSSAEDVRRDMAAALASVPGFERLSEVTFNRPVSARHWLEASNPMERWKWNAMFQDLPPVKGHNVQMENAPAPTVIPLRLVAEAE
jgi:NADH-quinone oxidoreductase subunit G